MNNEKVIDKIRKLLNLAYNGGDKESHEAQTALLMAQKLMVDHNIEEAMIGIENVNSSKKTVVQGTIISGAKISNWKKILAKIIADNFKCEIYLNPHYDGFAIVYLGLRDDVIMAKMAYDFALEAIEHNSKHYVKKRKKENPYINVANVKNSYIIGWLNGLQDQFREQVEKQGWGLILVKDKAVKEAMGKMKTKTQKAQITCKKDIEASAEGYKHGKQFNATAKRLPK